MFPVKTSNKFLHFRQCKALMAGYSITLKIDKNDIKNYLILPELGNSGTEHWQTYFENSGQNFIESTNKNGMHRPDKKDSTIRLLFLSNDQEMIACLSVGY